MHAHTRREKPYINRKTSSLFSSGKHIHLHTTLTPPGSDQYTLHDSIDSGIFTAASYGNIGTRRSVLLWRGIFHLQLMRPILNIHEVFIIAAPQLQNIFALSPWLFNLSCCVRLPIGATRFTTTSNTAECTSTTDTNIVSSTPSSSVSASIPRGDLVPASRA